MPLLESQHGYVCDGTHRQVAETVLLDLARGAQVDFATTSSSVKPRARNLSITFSMSFMPVFMLPIWISVEIESGRNPSLIAGTATRQRKLPPP